MDPVNFRRRRTPDFVSESTRVGGFVTLSRHFNNFIEENRSAGSRSFSASSIPQMLWAYLIANAGQPLSSQGLSASIGGTSRQQPSAFDTRDQTVSTAAWTTTHKIGMTNTTFAPCIGCRCLRQYRVDFSVPLRTVKGAASWGPSWNGRTPGGRDALVAVFPGNLVSDMGA